VRRRPGAVHLPDDDGRGAVTRAAWLAALLATGCVEHATDHRPGTIDDAVSISARWIVQDLAGPITACPAGFNTAVLVTQPVDASGVPTGEPVSDRFACDVGAGESRALVDGAYLARVEIRSRDLSQRYAASLPQVIGVIKLRQVLTVTILNDAGFAEIGWQLVDAGGAALDCAALASPSEIAVHGVDTADATRTFDDHLSCPRGRAVTHAVPAATYAITVSAIAGGAVVASAAPVTAAIGAHNAVTDLGTLTIAIPPPAPPP
jgi:hypothetical protein